MLLTVETLYTRDKLGGGDPLSLGERLPGDKIIFKKAYIGLNVLYTFPYLS